MSLKPLELAETLIQYSNADADEWTTVEFSSRLLFAKCTGCRGGKVPVLTFEQLKEPALAAAVKATVNLREASAKALRKGRAVRGLRLLAECKNKTCGCAGGLHFPCCTRKCNGALFHPGHYAPDDPDIHKRYRSALRRVDDAQIELGHVKGQKEIDAAKQKLYKPAQLLGNLWCRRNTCAGCRNEEPSFLARLRRKRLDLNALYVNSSTSWARDDADNCVDCCCVDNPTCSVRHMEVGVAELAAKQFTGTGREEIVAALRGVNLTRVVRVGALLRLQPEISREEAEEYFHESVTASAPAAESDFPDDLRLELQRADNYDMQTEVAMQYMALDQDEAERIVSELGNRQLAPAAVDTSGEDVAAASEEATRAAEEEAAIATAIATATAIKAAEETEAEAFAFPSDLDRAAAATAASTLDARRQPDSTGAGSSTRPGQLFDELRHVRSCGPTQVLPPLERQRRRSHLRRTSRRSHGRPQQAPEVRAWPNSGVLSRDPGAWCDSSTSPRRVPRVAQAREVLRRLPSEEARCQQRTPRAFPQAVQGLPREAGRLLLLLRWLLHVTNAITP